jgi:uncharacterized protein YuzE
MDEKVLELKLNYDAKADVLYCSLGEPAEAISVEEEEGVLLRLDPETKMIVGMTVIDFSKKFAGQPGRILSFKLAAPLRSALTGC